jgi:DNA-binding winged helix-turn-helix (wHTH) protein
MAHTFSRVKAKNPESSPDREAGERRSPLLFIGFKADPANNELYSEATGTVRRLEPRTMDVLLLLARNAGQVVSRQAFAEIVWPGRRVVDDSLSQCISELRKALGDTARAPTYIRTVPKRGYCFLPAVTWEATASPSDRAGKTRTGAAFSRQRRVIGSLLVLTLIILPLFAYLEGGETVPDVVAMEAQDFMPLLSPGPDQASRIQVSSSAGPADHYLIERSWLEDGRARLQLRSGDDDAVLWQVDRSVSSAKDRQTVLSELAAVASLAKTQQTGPLLRALPLAQQRLFKRARHHADRRTEADLLIARDLLEQILSYDPEYVEAILLLAELQQGLASHDQTENGQLGYRAARAMLIERAKQVAPDHPAVTAMGYEPGISMGRVDWGQYEEDLQTLVSEAPDCVACVRRLGDFYLQVGWFEEALAVWTQYRHYWPLSVGVHAAIGRLQARLGNAAGALQQVEMIRALAGADAWDVLAAEVNAYLILGDESRWLNSLERLMSGMGERGQARIAFYEAMLAGDEARLRALAEREDLARDFNVALTLGEIDPLVARVQKNVTEGEYRDLRLVHGWIHHRNAMNGRYMDGLARLQRDTRIQTLFDDIGLTAFWHERGKHPDYCSAAASPPPHCA